MECRATENYFCGVLVDNIEFLYSFPKGSNNMKLDKGKAYYDVSFSTHNVEIPEIDTYIYIGSDIFNEGKGEHFFQSPWSYFMYGDFTEITDPKMKPNAQISVMPSEIVENLYSLPELVEYLRETVSQHSKWFGEINDRPS